MASVTSCPSASSSPRTASNVSTFFFCLAMTRNFIETSQRRYHRSVRLRVFSSSRFADHVTPPGHPERVSRAEVLLSVAADLRAAGAEVVEPRRVTDDELRRVHDADYLTTLRETAGRAVALDPDTFTSPESYEVAR